jgi:hypothetical protein
MFSNQLIRFFLDDGRSGVTPNWHEHSLPRATKGHRSWREEIRAILVRVGIDQAYGEWNAPVAEDLRFVYVPIPEAAGVTFHSGLARKYSEIVPAIERFRRDHDGVSEKDVRIPDGLLKKPMHLDPDFGCLTYGDEGARRGTKIKELCENDLLVFYAGLRPVF